MTSLKAPQHHIILLRHYPKLYDNTVNEKHGFDPPLITNEEQEIKNQEMSRQILQDFKGSIDLIICSPYLRTRQTADYFMNLCPSAKIIYDVRFGEYLGHHRKKIEKRSEKWRLQCLLDEETQKYPISIQNSIKEYQDHVHQIIDEINNLGDSEINNQELTRDVQELIIANFSEFQSNLWHNKKVLIITHGLFLQFAHLKIFEEVLPKDQTLFSCEF